jgi:hypothetical protein
MKTKAILSVICAMLALSGLAKQIIVCSGGRYTSYTYDQCSCCNNISNVVKSDLGPCSGPNRVVYMNKVIGTGSPGILEMDDSDYELLQSSGSVITSSQEDIDYIASVIENNEGTHVWVAPGKVNQGVYTSVYGTDPYLDIYFVRAYHGATAYNLDLYSDQAKTVTVEYRDLYGILIDSENVSVASGHSIATLSKPTILSGGTYHVKVISSTSYQSLMLQVD